LPEQLEEEIEELGKTIAEIDGTTGQAIIRAKLKHHHKIVNVYANEQP